MQYNLVLLDRAGKLLNYVLSQRSDQIIALVCEMNSNITQLIEKYPDRINNVIDYDKLLDIQNVENINYDLIAKFKSTQIDIETMLHRIMLNNPLAKDIYHQHLSYFTEIFKNHNANLLLCSEPNLTSPNHHIPFALCKFLGIPCYALGSYHYTAFALSNYNNPHDFVPLSKNLQSLVKNIPYYELKTKKTISRKNLKRVLKDLVLKIGGEMLSQFLVCLYKMNFQQDRLGVPYSYWTKLYYFFKYKQMKKFYDKHSVVPNLKDKYIYYSIHFEPEAAIIGKTILESQLTVIKMLSKALPKGWKLYVKEHPHQFMLNNEIAHYFLNNLNYFKNIEFYKEIMKLENVLLVSLKIPSKELMQNSQAIATFGGTISLESALNKIPAILFNPLDTIYRFLTHTLHIHSYSDLVEAIQKIQNNFLKDVEKIDLNTIDTYLANPNDPHFYNNLFSAIEEHAKTIEPTGETL